MILRRFRMSGDEGVGLFEPPDIVNADFLRLESRQLARLRRVGGLSATASEGSHSRSHGVRFGV